MPYQVRRDFVGYGGNMPDPKWPDGARLAVNFVLNYEEGSEPSVQDGEGHTDIGLTEAHGMGQTIQGRDLAGESLFEFGSRAGFWRINRLFRERDLPMTVYGCALAFERNAAVSKAIKDAGYDICSHGWRWIKHYELGEAEERDHIAKAIAATVKMIGERPLGWYCRYGPGENTRRLLVEEGGFLYDSDYYGDELPFWVSVEGKGQLVVPYTLTNNDGKYLTGIGNADQWFTLLRDAFDMLYREGATEPKMMSIGMHCRLLGQAARAVGLERLLDYMQKHKGVWITKRVEIARHWHKVHPYPGKGLND
jgi:peptidoglycan/xylan/chitin deacetylase (PgdA/CDA1 family)